MNLFLDLILSSAGIVGGVATLRSARAYLDRRPARRALAKTPPLSPTSADGGRVTVTGVVTLAERTIEAPLTARPCVVARARVRIMQKGLFGIGAPTYETFAIVPFIVDAPRIGRVRVESRYATLDVPCRAMSERRSAPGTRERMLDDHALSDGTRSTPLFDESIVEVGTVVRVAGLLMKEVPPDPDFAERGYRATPTMFVLRGTVDFPIAIGRPASRRT